MIRFILNDTELSTNLLPGIVVLDFLREHLRLTGTKEGCREGDCGACLVLLGEPQGETVRYKPVNSCLLPLGEIAGKHVVTIEGLNREGLNPIQQAIVDEGATQCGYCTPGIVVALTGFLLNHPKLDEYAGLTALDGNICRCTGYMSIKRAIALLCDKFRSLTEERDRVRALVERHVLPDFFLHIPDRLRKIQPLQPAVPMETSPSKVVIAGGTDLFVQKPEELKRADFLFLSHREDLRGICIKRDKVCIGVATTFEEMKSSPVLRKLFPRIGDHLDLVASTPIRHRATVGGNIVNASPIGDLTIFFLGLDATIMVSNGPSYRELPLREFFQAYKQLRKRKSDLVKWISFPLPEENALFNFEKVSKRTHLDIASVNSAIQIRVEDRVIRRVHLSAGGVAPIPLYLSRTADYLVGKEVNAHWVREAASVAQEEISPISDVRGTADYRRLLLRRLIFAHFVTLFPEQIDAQELL